jgi:hypothetical protein
MPARKILVVSFLICALAGAILAQVRNPEQLGPYPVCVTSIQVDDPSRPDPELGPRPLRTEIWYPSVDATRGMPVNKYSEFVLRGVVPGSMAEAEAGLGSYKKGLTLAELDRTFQNIWGARRAGSRR